jgi:taurine dioxygenase
MNILPLPGAVGVEVTGLETGESISEQTAKELRSAWLDAGIVLLRGVGTSPEVLLRVSRCLGDLEPHPIEHLRLPGYPELILLSNEHGSMSAVYDFDGVPTYGRIPWHTDLVYTVTPNAGAVLRMVKNSEHAGQTGWIDTAMAWQELDAATKERIDELEGRFIFTRDLDGMRFNKAGGRRLSETSSEIPDFIPVAHPLVWVHPETGLRSLNISTLNIQSILGLPDDEGDRLIQQLVEHTLQPRFQYVHEWASDDIVAWDNRRTMHMAFGHPMDEIRIVQRSTIRNTVKMGRLLEDMNEAHST